MKAAHACTGYEYDHTPLIGLMPVSKLKCIRNNKMNEFCSRYFRVNAVKDHVGHWREFPNGGLVNFHHFPDFDPDKGDQGDTLIWDAFSNELKIKDKVEKYPAMCYKSYDEGMKQ